MNLSINSEKYKRGLEYEVLDECISIEMAYHGARLHEAGDDSEQGRLHLKAIKALKELSDSIDLDDKSTIEGAWFTLDAMKAERKPTINLSISATLTQDKQNAVCRVVA